MVFILSQASQIEAAVFWDMTPCRLLGGYISLFGIQCRKYEAGIFLRNVSNMHQTLCRHILLECRSKVHFCENLKYHIVQSSSD
jgi:hypothetical protein